MAGKKSTARKQLSAAELERLSVAREAMMGGSPRFADLFASTPVRVTIGNGKSQTSFYLHRDTLVKKSPYFRTKVQFQESNQLTSDVIHVDEDLDDYDAFSVFVAYIYTGKYDVPSGLDQPQICMLHVRVYVLAERLCMDDLRAEALQKMTDTLKIDSPAPGADAYPAFSSLLSPKAVVQLLKMVYAGTRDNHRWFERGNVLEDKGSWQPQQPQELRSKREDETDDGSIPEPFTVLEAPSRGSTDLQAGSEGRTAQDTSRSGMAMRPKLEQDEMRRLVSRYAAANLKTLREDAGFMVEIAKGGQITTDIVLAT